MMGFKSSVADPSKFVHTEYYIAYILVYMDDMVVTGSDQGKVDTILRKLREQFIANILGNLSYFPTVIPSALA